MGYFLYLFNFNVQHVILKPIRVAVKPFVKTQLAYAERKQSVFIDQEPPQ